MDLKLELAFDQPSCLQGESATFRITLTNTGKVALDSLRSIAARAKSLRLFAHAPAHTTVVGLELGPGIREFRYERLHLPELPPLRLAPGAKVEVRGDLLAWMGELPADDYRVQAIYYLDDDPDVSPFVSAEVPLQILRPNVVDVSVPRWPEMRPDEPVSALWRNGKPGESIVLLDLHSRRLPPNPARCVRIGDLPADAALFHASMALAGTVGHVLWVHGGKLHVLAPPTDRPSQEKPTTVSTPLRQPAILESPRTTADGRLLALLTSEKSDALCLLDLPRGKPPQITELPLETFGPIDQCCVYWTLDDDAMFLWSKAVTREVFATRIVPTDARAAFAPRRLLGAADGLLRLELLRDAESDPFFREGLVHVEHQGQAVPITTTLPTSRPSPDPVYTAFLLTHDAYGKQLVLSRAALPGAPEQVYAQLRFDAGVAPRRLETLHSAMTGRKEPVYLLRDDAGAVYFVSSLEQRIAPLEQKLGRPVTAALFPRLFVASERADVPWVFVRVLDAQRREFVFEKLEPADQDSPYRLLQDGDALP